MGRLIRVVTPTEEVIFDASAVIINHKPEGIRITPSPLHENELGFLSLFYPWGEVRQIKEYESGS